MDCCEQIENLDQLRTYVHEQLCARENLLVNEFPMSEERLVRQGEFCGIQFQLHGPRRVRLGAIWTRDRNVVYFYDTRGQRFQKIQLSNSFQLEMPLAS